MHYGDKEQLEEARLEVVIYKHEKVKDEVRLKSGRLSRKCVGYEITSIQECKFVNPMALRRLLKDTYRYVKRLDDMKFEEWYLVRFRDVDGYGKLSIESIHNVSLSQNQLLKLH